MIVGQINALLTGMIVVWVLYGSILIMSSSYRLEGNFIRYLGVTLRWLVAMYGKKEMLPTINMSIWC